MSISGLKSITHIIPYIYISGDIPYITGDIPYIYIQGYLQSYYIYICFSLYTWGYSIYTFFYTYFSGWWFQPLWKIWKSVGIIIPNIWKKMFQTTNQIYKWGYFIYNFFFDPFTIRGIGGISICRTWGKRSAGTDVSARSALAVAAMAVGENWLANRYRYCRS